MAHHLVLFVKKFIVNYQFGGITGIIVHEMMRITKLNYLFMNPIKHGYVTNLNEYQFSSFSHKINEIGRYAMVKQFHIYNYNPNINDIFDDF